MTLAGATIANETDYDWTLPFRIDGYDAFGGMYGDLNLQVYWDDNADKLTRFQDILNQTDYIFIPTNHQYAQIPRIPERYPLTTVYYRELIGCPPDADILWCYRVAEPGMFQGRLGFELVKIFTSYPTLGPLSINDGAAEEAFTFYDHPKVLIFQKTADYDPAKVAAVLGAVDLTKVVRLAPNEVNSYKPPKSLMLPPDQLAQYNKRAGRGRSCSIMTGYKINSRGWDWSFGTRSSLCSDCSPIHWRGAPCPAWRTRATLFRARSASSSWPISRG